MRHAQERREKRQGTWNLADSVPFPHGHGGRPFIFLFMMIIFDLGKPWIFSFYMPYLTILYLPTYVRSPSFSEKQGRSDQVIFFLSRDKAKFERRNLVVGSWYCRDFRLPRCAQIHTLSVCLSLSPSLRMNRSKYLVSFKSHILLTARITALSSGQEDPVSSAKAR